MTVADNLRVPLLYTVDARAGLAHSRRGHRRTAALELLALVGLEHQAERCRAT